MAQEDSFSKYKLRKSLDTLRNKRSEDGSTCLITLYIPEDRVISDFVSELSNEAGTAQNIKSKTTRKNVISALQVTIGKLKLLPIKAPKNGLALFTGVTQTGRMESYVINPATPIARKQYICDAVFHIDHLEEHLLEKRIYALITIDGGYGTIGTLQGNHVTVLRSMQSAVPKKHSRGGQSAPRFGRIRQGALDTFLKRVSNAAKDLFIEDSNRAKLIAGVIIGGPGLLKYRLAEEEYLDPRLQEKLLKTIDIGMVSDKEGLQELVEKSQDTLAGTRFNEERVIVQKWLNLIYRDDPLAVYGEDELRRHLQAGAVDLFLGSEGMGKSRVTFQCTNQTSHENQCLTMSSLDVETRGITEIPPCKVCGASMVVQEPVVDLLEELGEIATRTGSKVEIISTETEEGQQLLHFGGVAGVLRYLLNE